MQQFFHNSISALRRSARRVYRSGAHIALPMLLWLGLFEPLACILHCDLWMPLFAPQTHAAHQHTQHSKPLFGMLADASIAVAAPCVLLDGATPESDAPLAAPFHEMALWPMLLLLSLIPLQSLLMPMRRAAPWRALPPPLRPPIFCH